MDQSAAATLKRTNLGAGLAGAVGLLLVFVPFWILEQHLALQMLPWWFYLGGAVFLGGGFTSGVLQWAERRAALKAMSNFMEQSRAQQGRPRL